MLSQRVSMAQAGRVKDALASSLGTRMEIGGVEVTCVPGPGRSAAARRVPGRLGTRSSSASARWRRPRWQATSTRRFLRGARVEEALTHLESLPGIGPFGAMLVLARGAGHPDVPPPTLRRFRAAVAAAYGLDEEPDEAKLAELSEAWRPYRAWVTWLLRSVDAT